MGQRTPAGIKFLLPQFLEFVVSHVFIFYQVDARVPTEHAVHLSQAV